jgi:hypothetical protein
MNIYVMSAVAVLLAHVAPGMADDPRAGVEIDAGTWAISCPKPLSPAAEVAVRLITSHAQESWKDGRLLARCLHFDGPYSRDTVRQLRALTSPEGIVSRLPHDNAVVVVDEANRVREIEKKFAALDRHGMGK